MKCLVGRNPTMECFFLHLFGGTPKKFENSKVALYAMIDLALRFLK